MSTLDPWWIEYARWVWKLRAQRERYARRVQAQRPRLVCQDCRGAGGYKEVVCDDGTGPWYDCGWCFGTGLLTPWLRGLYLRTMKHERVRARLTAGA